MTYVYRFGFGHKFSTHLGKEQETQLLGQMVRGCLVLQETAKLSSRVAGPFCTPISNEGEFLLLHILLAFGVSVLDLGHSNRCDDNSF